jgi:hypothetical protein
LGCLCETHSYSFLQDDPEVCRLAALDMLCNIGVSAMIDMGVHYDGWDITETADYLRASGFNDAAAEAIFQAVVQNRATI